MVPKVALVSIASLSAIFSQMAYPVFSIKDSSNFDSENAPCLCVERALASHQKARPVLFQVRIPYCSRGYSHFSLKMPFAFQQRPPFGSRALCRLGPRGIPCIRSKGASRCSSNGFPSFGFKGRSRSACNCVPCFASNGIPRFVPMVSQAPAPKVFPVPARPQPWLQGCVLLPMFPVCPASNDACVLAPGASPTLPSPEVPLVVVPILPALQFQLRRLLCCRRRPPLWFQQRATFYLQWLSTS